MQHLNLHHVHDLPDFGACFLAPKTLNYLAFQSFDFERT
jgi:hypothetical protein